MRSFEHLTDLQTLVGETIGVSDWITVDQHRINLFADATGDHQWIHLDAERAASGPFGTTIAHGFLTLSLLPEMSASAFQIQDTRMGVNYGLGKVRFPAPVPSGSRLRGHFKLTKYEPLEGGARAACTGDRGVVAQALDDGLQRRQDQRVVIDQQNLHGHGLRQCVNPKRRCSTPPLRRLELRYSGAPAIRPRTPACRSLRAPS